MTAQAFTVFARWNDNSERQGKPCYFPTFKDEVARSLPERIELVRNYFGAGSFIPVAWTTDLVGLGDFEQWEAMAVAAGRLIEFRDGKYIPLGVAEESPKPIKIERIDRIDGPFFPPMPPLSVRVGATEKKRPPLTWATPKPVDRWEGYEVVKSLHFDELDKKYRAYISPLQRMTDPSDPLHGSAWLKVR